MRIFTLRPRSMWSIFLRQTIVWILSLTPKSRQVLISGQWKLKFSLWEKVVEKFHSDRKEYVKFHFETKGRAYFHSKIQGYLDWKCISYFVLEYEEKNEYSETIVAHSIRLIVTLTISNECWWQHLRAHDKIDLF